MPTSTGALAGCTSESSPPSCTTPSRASSTGRSTAPRSALALFDACIPAIPYAAASAFLGREKAKLARSDGDRPRVALVADGIGSMHGVTHTIQQIRDPRRPRVRRRGDRHRRRRRPPAQRGRRDRRPVLPRASRSASRPSPRSSTRSPRAATTSSTSARRVPPGSAPGCSRGCSSCRGSAATTPSSPPTRRSAPARRSSRCSPTGARHVLRGLRRRPLAEPRERRTARPARHRRRADPALGSRRRPEALRPGPSRRGPAPRRDQRALRGTPQQGEGSRPARRRVPRGPPPRPAPAPRR